MSDYATLIHDLATATSARAEAEGQQKQLALECIRAGHTKTDVATTARISRSTLDRWLDGEDTIARYDVDETIREAFAALVGAGSTQAAPYMTTSLIPPMAQQIMGTCIKNVGRVDFDSEVGQAVARAQQVIDAAIRYHASTGKWPQTVTLYG